MISEKQTTITATEMQQKSGQIIKNCYVEREHFIVKLVGFPIVDHPPIRDHCQISHNSTAVLQTQ